MFPKDNKYKTATWESKAGRSLEPRSPLKKKKSKQTVTHTDSQRDGQSIGSDGMRGGCMSCAGMPFPGPKCVH